MLKRHHSTQEYITFIIGRVIGICTRKKKKYNMKYELLLILQENRGNNKLKFSISLRRNKMKSNQSKALSALELSDGIGENRR